MAKGRLKSKTKIQCLKKLETIKLNEQIKNKYPIKHIFGSVFQTWSEYCDFLYLVCVVGPMKVDHIISFFGS